MEAMPRGGRFSATDAHRFTSYYKQSFYAQKHSAFVVEDTLLTPTSRRECPRLIRRIDETITIMCTTCSVAWLHTVDSLSLDALNLTVSLAAFSTLNRTNWINMEFEIASVARNYSMDQGMGKYRNFH